MLYFLEKTGDLKGLWRETRSLFRPLSKHVYFLFQMDETQSRKEATKWRTGRKCREEKRTEFGGFANFGSLVESLYDF